MSRRRGGLMEDQIEYGAWAEVETDQGTEYVQIDVTGEPGAWCGSEVTEDHGIVFANVAGFFEQYVSGRIRSIKRISGYGARLSAPGYLDCTEWAVFKTEAAAKEYLREMYHDDE